MEISRKKHTSNREWLKEQFITGWYSNNGKSTESTMEYVALRLKVFLRPTEFLPLVFEWVDLFPHTTIDDLNLLGSLVDVSGSHRSRNFDLQSILSALSRSKAITAECLDALGIAELISQLMTLLPTGFHSNLGYPAEIPLRSSSRPEHCAPPTICPLRVPFLCDGVYELEERFSDRKPRNGDVIKLRLGGILTGSTSRILVGDAKVCVPSALEDGRLMTLFGDYDGWYEDHQGIQQRLSKEVLRVVDDESRTESPNCRGGEGGQEFRRKRRQGKRNAYLGCSDIAGVAGLCRPP